jgi:hypothetical protein
MNRLLHGVEHIIALRHEFALDRNEDGILREPTHVQRYGGENKHSVMSYDDINHMNAADIIRVMVFYSMENKSLLNGVPITDYTPKPLRL